MEKVIYLVWGDRARAESAGFGDDVVGVVRRGLDAADARGGRVHVACQEIANRRATPSGPPPESLWCMASAWFDDIIERRPFEDTLAELGAPSCDGYLVTESVPRWRPGSDAVDPMPGVQMLSILNRPAAMTHDQFVDHWIDSHLALSLDTHPQWTYVRNIITKNLTPGARTFDAVCEHGFSDPEHILDPRFFYGAGSDRELLAKNQKIIGDDAAMFVDFARTASQVTQAYILRAAFEPIARAGRPYAGPATL
jgi:hypothetical protein